MKGGYQIDVRRKASGFRTGKTKNGRRYVYRVNPRHVTMDTSAWQRYFKSSSLNSLTKELGSHNVVDVSKILGSLEDKAAKKRPSQLTNRLTFTAKGYHVVENIRVKNILISALKGGIVFATVAAFPVTAPIVIPAYQFLNYATLGTELYRLYQDIKRKRSEAKITKSASTVAGSAVAEASDNTVHSLSKQIVLEAQKRGITNAISVRTSVDESVYSSMLEGSVKDGFTTGAGELASYAIQSI